MRTTVVMIDRKDSTLHLPATGRGNLVTVCGLVLDHTTIGPRWLLDREGMHRCPECWDHADEP